MFSILRWFLMKMRPVASLDYARPVPPDPPPLNRHGTAPKILQRFPKYPLGCFLKKDGCLGIVDAIYSDYTAAVNSFIIPPNWFEQQVKPPSSRDQIFYSIIVVEERDGTVYAVGAILAGENDVELAERR